MLLNRANPSLLFPQNYTGSNDSVTLVKNQGRIQEM